MKYEHQYGQVRKLMRWDQHDYSSQCIYFVTIVTYMRQCLFGRIADGEMQLNDAGRMVAEQYRRLESDEVKCLDMVVMPNHIHFVIYLRHDGAAHLPAVIRNFKSITTHRYCKGVKEHGWPPFSHHLWQRSYWEEIVRNERALDFICRYIHFNPERWGYDKDNENHGEETDQILATLRKIR